MRALYISHNGMLENLGQAQVLPYVRGLAKRGVEFDLLSFELPDTSADRIAELAASLSNEGIRWTPLHRARDTRLRVKLFESSRGVYEALAIAARRRPAIVHGRSYLPTAVGDFVASAIPKARLVFDCRGMVGDEYVDIGHWTRDRIEYRLVKRYERRVFQRAEGVVVLTETLKKIVNENHWLGERSTIVAIPCCVDLERFRFSATDRDRIRDELGIADKTVIVYSGSLGGWYRDEDLATLAGLIKKQARGSRASARRVALLVLTHQDAKGLRDLAIARGLMADEIIVRKVAPADMAKYLSAGDVAVSFIKSCFSKLGSSPTKVAEYLACGLPVVLNGDIGDQGELRVEEGACIVLDTFSDDTLADAAARALTLADRPLADRIRITREVAERRFGLERVGVARYAELYETLGRQP